MEQFTSKLEENSLAVLGSRLKKLFELVFVVRPEKSWVIFLEQLQNSFYEFWLNEKSKGKTEFKSFHITGTSLVVQRLRICLPMQGT